MHQPVLPSRISKDELGIKSVKQCNASPPFSSVVLSIRLKILKNLKDLLKYRMSHKKVYS